MPAPPSVSQRPAAAAGALWQMAWASLPADLLCRLAAEAAALEIGCGAGLSCLALAQAFAGLTVTGHDRDARAVARARALGRAAGLADRLKFEVNDSQKLPRAAFDLITAVALRDDRDLGQCFNRIRNALRPQGSCLLLAAWPPDHGRPAGPLRDDDAALAKAARNAGFSRFVPVPSPDADLFELRR